MGRCKPRDIDHVIEPRGTSCDVETDFNQFLVASNNRPFGAISKILTASEPPQKGLQQAYMSEIF